MSSTSQLMPVLPWVSTAAVAVLGALALARATHSRPVTATGRRLRLTATAVAAALALGGSIWQAGAVGAGREPLVARDLAVRVAAAQEKIKRLERQLNELGHRKTTRMILAEAAKQLSEFLQQFGSRRVVVSCAPNDIEAYNYATQLTNVLKSAKWDARGPEVTAIFGNIRTMAINVYDDAAPGADTAKILLAGFAKFNIPFQTRVAPMHAPDDAAVELFVGTQPLQQTDAAGGQRTH